MSREQFEHARRAGEKWADAKAEMLEGDIPAIDWPDVWRREWDGPLGVNADDRQSKLLQDEAHHAAVERWAFVVDQHRQLEDLEDEELDERARATRLYGAVRRDLPRGLAAGIDGPRVYVQDQRTGEEMTVTSLRQAWKVIEQWRELSH